ncbi:ferritin-like metal-binding protein YciE [Flavobacterium sp. CG_23.5]|uniref:YciE/YciF ferroxidase family protein n=1 Tax=Flavobacterium sp. CG_23.5 TaxID=2760708 RepID=UPI001AE3DCE6|nr:ferritin-like domain-containing protein [Flavobacterium sp. CG_23.5]MBP2284853.1 ferritin-like metal-binding protein YciE [Flavobacterium sp. CG_23.5]
MSKTKTKTEKKQSANTTKSKSSVATSLRELFIDSLKDIYWAEKALTKAIRKMVESATSKKLMECLEAHLTETEQQIKRLEEIFNILGEKVVAKKCVAMEGLIEEGKSIMDETAEGPVRDAGIIAAAQKVEHYEIATYGTLISFAKTLYEVEVADILAQTLEEEKQADETLSDAAYSSINFDAAMADEN